MIILYNPSTWCSDSGIVHFIKVQGKGEHSYFQTKAYVHPNVVMCVKSLYYLIMSEYSMGVEYK